MGEEDKEGDKGEFNLGKFNGRICRGKMEKEKSELKFGRVEKWGKKKGVGFGGFICFSIAL